MSKYRAVTILGGSLLALGIVIGPGLVPVAAGTHPGASPHAIVVVRSSDHGPTDFNIRYDVPDAAPTIQQDVAIKTARAVLGHRADQATQIRVRYVLFTKEDYFTVDAAGQKHLIWRRVPAWVVTFEGLTLPNHGGRPGARVLINHEANVVIHAGTGKPLEWFTYR